MLLHLTQVRPMPIDRSNKRQRVIQPYTGAMSLPTKTVKLTKSGLHNEPNKGNGINRKRGGFNFREETHYLDMYPANQEITSSGSVTLLNAVAAGTSVNQRAGKKWKMLNLQIKGAISNKASATFTDNEYMIIYDHRPGGALPAFNDIVDQNSQFINDAHRDRFNVLFRGNMLLTGTATAGDKSGYAKDFYHVIPINRTVINKAAGTGAIGDIDLGALYLVTWSYTGTGLTAAEMLYRTRLRFQDTGNIHN